MPCLNEEAGVGRCVSEAAKALLRMRYGGRGEIIVVDNGSTDRSVEIVGLLSRRSSGPAPFDIRLVREKERGYGAALIRGFREAKGQVIVMGDSDGSYNFGEIPKLVRPILSEGHDLVVGSRIKGRQEKGAMPWVHRFVGTPILTFIINRLFDLNLSDSQSGLRAIRASSYKKLGMRMTGMEFASEMLVRAKRAKLTIAEVSISYRCRSGDSKLVPLRDAWRHLRFLLLFSPTWMFTMPGMLLFVLGLIGFILTAPGPFPLGRGELDVHTLSISGMVMLLGFQALSLGIFARVYGKYSLGLNDRGFMDLFIEKFELERGIKAGSLLCLGGLGVLGWVVIRWVLAGFPGLAEIRPVLVGTVLMLLGVQVVFGSFFLSFLRGEGK